MRPDWKPLTTGTGHHNGGVWLTPDGLVVKRLLPGPERPRHHAYWQREALVAASGIVARTPGLGYLLVASDRGLDEQLQAYGDRSGTRRGTVLTAALTVVSRAAWALERPSAGGQVENLLRPADVVSEAARR